MKFLQPHVKDKFLFGGLAVVYGFFAFLSFKFLVFLVTPQIKTFSLLLGTVIYYSVDVLFLFIALKFFFTFLSSLMEKRIFYFPRAEHKFLYLLIKLLLSFGSLCGLDKEKILRSFFWFNNSLVPLWTFKEGSKPLLLLPRCLQYSQCEEKVIEDAANCKRCRKCSIAELAELTDTYDFDMYVATGGEAAKATLLRLKPSVIVAVACETELLINISEIPPYPIVTTANERPNGPCKDTIADVKTVEKYISLFAKKIK